MVDSTDTNVPSSLVTKPDNNPDEQDKFFDFQESRVHLNRLVSDWHSEIDETEQRRKERKVEIDVESLRQKNELDEDETIVPIRVIDTNISREQPSYINYLKNSRRIGIFEPLDNPLQDCDLLEQDFTKKCTYTGWEIPHFKCLDGSQLHGWDAIEVVLDEDKPGHFALEQIGHDKLFFPRSAIDIQKCPRIIRAYDVTILQLRPWIQKYGFDSAQVEKILNPKKNTQKEAETIRIYKLFFKKDDIVNIGWFCLSDGCDDWLKKPQQHYVGIDQQNPQTRQFIPIPLTMYPIFILSYKLDEQSKLIDARGRGFLDSYKQEALTALWSAYINGMNRACSIYGSPAQEDGTGSSLKEVEDLKITPGRFMNKPVNFWSPPYPDALVLRTLQFADIQNSDETNQVNFSAMNREDSRKTAKEIGAAQQQQTLLNSVQLTLFSTFIRQIYSFVWLIVQSQALQNKIQFLLIQKEVPIQHPMVPGQTMTGNNGQPMTQTIWVNDSQMIGQRYSIRAAGDVDVIAKEEMIQKMQKDWPVIMNTALKDVFLMDYVRLCYPERQQQYSQALQQGSQLNQLTSLVGRLSTVLEGLLKDHPEDLTNLPQQQQADLASTIQQAQQITGQQPQNK